MDWSYLFTRIEGRISRQPFWIGTAILTVISWLANLIISGFRQRHDRGLALPHHGARPALSSRLRSRPSAGTIAKIRWWNLTLLSRSFGWIWYSVECGFLAGTPGPNGFGPDPLGNPVPVCPAGPKERV